MAEFGVKGGLGGYDLRDPPNTGSFGGPPGGQYLGLGPAGYYLSHALFGKRWEEEEQRKQMEQLQQLLKELRPSKYTIQEPKEITQPTGRPAPTTFSDALAGVTDYPIPGPGYMPPGAGVQDYPIPGPGYLAQPAPQIEYPIPGPGYFGQRAEPGALPPGPPGYNVITVPPLYGEPPRTYYTFESASRMPGRVAWPEREPEIIDPNAPATPIPEPPEEPPLPPWAEAPGTEPSLGVSTQLRRPPERVPDMTKQDVTLPEIPPAGREPLPVTPEPAPTQAELPITPEMPVTPTAPTADRPVPEMETVRRWEPVEYTRPGRELLDIIADNPQMLTVLKAYPGLLQLIEKERERQMMAEVFKRPGAAPAGGPAAPGAPAVPGTAAAPAEPAEAEDPQVAATRAVRQSLEGPARAVIGTPAQATPWGQKIVEQYRESVTAEDAAIKNAAEGKKAKRLEEKEQLEEKEKADAKQWALDRAAELRAGGDERGARIWEARAKNPKYAEDLIKERELELRERELTTKEREPTKDRMLADAATYQLQQEGIVAPSRGQIAQRSFELSQKTDAATAEQTIRQAATKRLMDRGNQKPTDLEIAQEAVALKKELATAGATTVKIGAEERAANIMNEATQRAASQDLGETRPDGTPGMLWDPTYTKYMGPSWFTKADERYAVGERLPEWMPWSITTKQGALRAALEALAGRTTRALNGARASDKDMELTAKFTPNINDRPEVAQAKYRQAMEYLRILEEVAARQQGRPTYYETQNQGKREDLLTPPREGAPLPPPTPPANPPLRPPVSTPGGAPGAPAPPSAGNQNIIKDYVKPPGTKPGKKQP
jgi:hypothetical protein